MITMASVLVSLFLLQNPGLFTWVNDSDSSRLWAVPLILVGLFSYTVANAFVTLFEMSVETIFMCFCEDCERNDGSEARPYFMTETLRKITGKSVQERKGSI